MLLNKVIHLNHKLLTMKEEEPKNAEAIIKDICRRTKRKFSSEEKIRIVISGLRGDESINVICRKEGIAPALYYRWSKDFVFPRKIETMISIFLDFWGNENKPIQ